MPSICLGIYNQSYVGSPLHPNALLASIPNLMHIGFSSDLPWLVFLALFDL